MMGNANKNTLNDIPKAKLGHDAQIPISSPSITDVPSSDKVLEINESQ